MQLLQEGVNSNLEPGDLESGLDRLVEDDEGDSTESTDDSFLNIEKLSTEGLEKRSECLKGHFDLGEL